jgi:hypothetical protein
MFDTGGTPSLFHTDEMEHRRFQPHEVEHRRCRTTDVCTEHRHSRAAAAGDALH